MLNAGTQQLEAQKPSCENEIANKVAAEFSVKRQVVEFNSLSRKLNYNILSISVWKLHRLYSAHSSSLSCGWELSQFWSEAIVLILLNIFTPRHI